MTKSTVPPPGKVGFDKSIKCFLATNTPQDYAPPRFLCGLIKAKSISSYNDRSNKW